MLDIKAKEIVDEEYEVCENCGELTHEDDMNHAYAHNGFESYGESVYSECMQCTEFTSR